MSIRAHDRKCIALEQLETALNLWAGQDSYFSIITLAGAAEEILGTCLTAAGIDNSLESIKKDSTAMFRHLYGEEADPKVFANRANHARNQSKHFDPGSSPTLEIDAREEARDILTRAVENYWRLDTDLTPAMVRFQESESAA